MKTDIVIAISPLIPYLAEFWFSSYGLKYCWSVRLQDSLKCNISRKKWIMKFIFGMQINIEVFNKLILSHWVYVARHAQRTQNMKFMYLCNISRKTWRMQLIFCPQLNIKVFYKLIVWVCVVRRVQSTQNNKFAMPFQYVKENVRD